MRKRYIYYDDFFSDSNGRMRLRASKNPTPYSDIAICGREEAQRLCKFEPNKWCAISICAPSFITAGEHEVWDKKEQKFVTIKISNFELLNTKMISKYYFHDIDTKTIGGIMCGESDIKSILEFGKRCEGEALLVHCAAGISRSTAAAFLIILNSIKDKVKNPAETAMELVWKIRPILYPNKHMLELGLPLIARNKEELIAWWRELYNSRIWQRIGK